MVTRERLQSLLNYDASTGVFTWKSSRGRCASGYVAGSPNSRGYPSIQIDGQLYLAHRLAWLYMFGKFPAEEIDHIDGNRKNNAALNLREASHTENSHNKRLLTTTLSGLMGAHWDSRKKCWAARIQAYGERKFLGWFDTPELAHKAYVSAKRELHPFAQQF